MLAQNRQHQEDMEKLTGLRFPAVALKLIEDENDVPDDAVVPMRDWGKHIALCQAFAFARRQYQTIYMRKEDHWCWNPILTYGMISKELGKEGFRALHKGSDNPNASDPFLDSFPYLPYGKTKGVLMAPLHKADFVPDVTLIYCKNDQLRLFLMAIAAKTGKMVESSFTPFDSCTYSVVPAILEGNYRITIPDPGEYERGLTPEDDIILSVPKQKAEEFYKGVEAQMKQGNRDTFFPAMKEDFGRPPMYNVIFEAWGLDTGDDWDKPNSKK